MQKFAKIAIIDSGFDFKCALNNKIKDYKNFCGGTPIDKYGHGTSIVRIIDRLCPNCEFYIIKGLDDEGKSDFKTVESAIYHAADNNVDIINASFGVEADNYLKEINALYNELHNKNIVLINTRANDQSRNYLFEHHMAIKVVGGKNIKKDKLYYNDGVFYVMGIARMIPWLDNHYVLRGGNSFSLPLIIPYIIEAKKNGCKKADEIQSYLFDKATKVDQASIFYDYPLIERQQVKNKYIYDCIDSYMSNNGWQCNGNNLINILCQNYRAEELLRELESVFCHNLACEEFQYPDLFYIENLSNKIYEILRVYCNK